MVENAKMIYEVPLKLYKQSLLTQLYGHFKLKAKPKPNLKPWVNFVSKFNNIKDESDPSAQSHDISGARKVLLSLSQVIYVSEVHCFFSLEPSSPTRNVIVAATMASCCSSNVMLLSPSFMGYI